MATEKGDAVKKYRVRVDVTVTTHAPHEITRTFSEGDTFAPVSSDDLIVLGLLEKHGQVEPAKSKGE